MNITFRNLEDNEKEFKQLYKWCQNKYIYEWFEQRILSLNEITNKYKNKLKQNTQDIYIIKCDNKDIGLVQIYKYDNIIPINELKDYQNIYEYDLFIGEEDYISKGIGSIIVNKINELIYNNYKADAIILRPFKRNIRAIKCYEKSNFKNIYEYEGKDTLGNPEIISILLNDNK